MEVTPDGIVQLVYFVEAGAYAQKALFTIKAHPSAVANFPVKADKLAHPEYLQPVITQYFASNKSEIWS